MAITDENVMKSAAMAGRVQRWHTWNMLKPQTVAAHSHRVAMLYVQIYGLPRAEVLLFCLQHDLGELHSGDIPFGAKQRSVYLKGASNDLEIEGLTAMGLTQPVLTEQEFKRVKICDILELYEHCSIEFYMGNQFAQVCCENVKDVLMKYTGSEDEKERLLKLVEGELLK